MGIGAPAYVSPNHRWSRYIRASTPRTTANMIASSQASPTTMWAHLRSSPAAPGGSAATSFRFSRGTPRLSSAGGLIAAETAPQRRAAGAEAGQAAGGGARPVLALRRCGLLGPAAVLHLELAVEERPLLHDQGGSIDLAAHLPGGPDLHAADREQLPLDLTGDGDLGGDDLGVDPRPLLDIHGLLRLDLAASLALHADAVLGAQLAVERRLAAHDRLDLTASAGERAAEWPRGLAGPRCRRGGHGRHGGRQVGGFGRVGRALHGLLAVAWAFEQARALGVVWPAKHLVLLPPCTWPCPWLATSIAKNARPADRAPGALLAPARRAML